MALLKYLTQREQERSNRGTKNKREMRGENVKYLMFSGIHLTNSFRQWPERCYNTDALRNTSVNKYLFSY